MIRRIALLSMMAFASCSAPSDVPKVTRAVIAPEVETFPRMLRFDGTQPRVVPLGSNRELARDFLDLSFGLESGREIATFSRYEGPVSVSVKSGAPDGLSQDLDQLLVRLRAEARVDIRRIGDGQPANITVQAMPRDEFQRLVPEAACFVVPGVSSWNEYLTKRRSAATDWTLLKTRTKATVFLPSDVSPQEVRDCLHEEIAQALGPLNDLHRLPWSVFNDDNLHAVLTGFDMMMLRVTYDSALRSGMTRAQVAQALPGILRRINPRGEADAATKPIPPSTPAWSRAISRALQPSGSARGRATAAKAAVHEARAEEWDDVRLGYSLLAYGRAALYREPEIAIAAFVEAAAHFKARYGVEVHAAQAAIQPAAFSLAAGQHDITLRITEAHLPAARAGQNAALTSTLLLLQAEALEASGQAARAKATRREAQGWGLYGFGTQEAVRQHTAEVAALRAGL